MGLNNDIDLTTDDFAPESKTRRLARKSLMLEANNKKHICETLRMIYDEVYELPDSDSKTTMTELLIDAITMAKKMQNRLYYYQKEYSDNTGNKADHIIGLQGVRARAKKRKERVI